MVAFFLLISKFNFDQIVGNILQTREKEVFVNHKIHNQEIFTHHIEKRENIDVKTFFKSTKKF